MNRNSLEPNNDKYEYSDWAKIAFAPKTSERNKELQAISERLRNNKKSRFVAFEIGKQKYS
ncbi:hypothetical protein [Companilactobacillus hulinensis]|uniref:hypothetical protein n=1 Tax=Companilactobacillus hulinensis TaxID=2486007 RepID=UPI000F7A26BF|nr:hypothetical protein [Companilactobacillus hulinensis]